jgi:hypothetical protein
VDKKTRPIPECSFNDCSHKIKVRVGMTLLKILAVDQREGSFKVVVWHRMTWTDYRLFYNVSDVHGFAWDSDKDFVPVEAKSLWTPDIELLNAAAMPEQSNNEEPRAYLYDEAKARKDGYNVYLSIPTIYTSKCDLELGMFPFDTQTCELVFGAWSASSRFVDFGRLTQSSSTIGLPEKNEEFEVVSVEGRTDVYESALITPGVEYPTVVYSIKLQRHTRYYIVNYILPLGTLVVLSAMTFWLRIDSGERQGYQVTMLLAVFAVAYLAAERLPASPTDTWIEEFQTWCLILTVVPAVESVVLDSFHGEFGKEPTDTEMKNLVLVDAGFRILHPLAILAIIWAYFLGRADVRNQWSQEWAVMPLSWLLVLISAGAFLAACLRLAYVDLPRIK